MGMVSTLLGFVGLAQQVPEVEDAEQKVIVKAFTLTDQLFAWAETKVANHLVIKSGLVALQNLIDTHGHDDLVSFLASKGITITTNKDGKP